MMDRDIRKFLFSKGILVGDEVGEDAFAACVTLASWAVEIVEGKEHADKALLLFVSEMLGKDVPLPFYRDFPESVRALSRDERLYDQLLHYAETYGLGNTEQAGHSRFEQDLVRLAFAEDVETRRFVILTEREAVKRMSEIARDMLLSTRPLNDHQYAALRALIEDHAFTVDFCVCKDTLLRLLIDTRDVRYARHLMLSDVIGLVETMNVRLYANANIKRLALRNRDRRLIAAVLDALFEQGRCDVTDCFEKKAIWCGLLHHIHYVPKTDEGRDFVAMMRGRGNRSVYAAFERAMAKGDIRGAVEHLRDGKGSGALLRHLNYILSRCESDEDVALVLCSLKTRNVTVLIQLLMQYANYSISRARTFKFSRHGLLRMHTETRGECIRRRSTLSCERVEQVSAVIREMLRELLSGRLGKVYIAPEMYRVAIPIGESSASGGYGVLPRGTRIPLEKGKKIRAFTYWEGVDDIDLSAIGIDLMGDQEEFSWRTMYDRQADDITYSGDQTSGFHGGSEYFDVDAERLREYDPDIRRLIFCNNVYSALTFDQCVCRAGYMLRDVQDTGEVFEPRTVKSSFVIDCPSTFAYLFGIDLETNELVWLNISRESNVHIAGTTEMGFLDYYFNATSVLSLGQLFELMATDVVGEASEADVVLSDGEHTLAEGAEHIHSYDFERITALIG